MTAIVNPGGAFGSAASNPQGAVVRPFLFATTTSQGQLVALSTSTGVVIKSLTDTAQKLLVGVALSNIAAGGIALVCTYGPCYGVKKDTASAVTAGDVVTRAATDTAGAAPIGGTTAVTQYKDIALGIGIVMANAVATATVCDLFIAKQ